MQSRQFISNTRSSLDPELSYQSSLIGESSTCYRNGKQRRANRCPRKKSAPFLRDGILEDSLVGSVAFVLLPQNRYITCQSMALHRFSQCPTIFIEVGNQWLGIKPWRVGRIDEGKVCPEETLGVDHLNPNPPVSYASFQRLDLHYLLPCLLPDSMTQDELILIISSIGYNFRCEEGLSRNQRSLSIVDRIVRFNGSLPLAMEERMHYRKPVGLTIFVLLFYDS